jgi:hypothetical protein
MGNLRNKHMITIEREVRRLEKTIAWEVELKKKVERLYPIHILILVNSFK